MACLFLSDIPMCTTNMHIQCILASPNAQVEKLWELADDDWIVRPKHEDMLAYERDLKATLASAWAEAGQD